MRAGGPISVDAIAKIRVIGSVLMRLTSVFGAQRHFWRQDRVKRHKLKRLGVAPADPTVHVLLIVFSARPSAMHQVAPPTPNNKPTTWTAITLTMVIEGKIMA